MELVFLVLLHKRHGLLILWVFFKVKHSETPMEFLLELLFNISLLISITSKGNNGWMKKCLSEMRIFISNIKVNITQYVRNASETLVSVNQQNNAVISVFSNL